MGHYTTRRLHYNLSPSDTCAARNAIEGIPYSAHAWSSFIERWKWKIGIGGVLVMHQLFDLSDDIGMLSRDVGRFMRIGAEIIKFYVHVGSGRGLDFGFR